MIELYHPLALMHMAHPAGSLLQQGPSMFLAPHAAPSFRASSIDPASYLHSDPCVISGA